MKAKATEVGRVVRVTQGHDAGSWCAVISVLDERYVLLCDGRLRTLAKPKKKQVKHLNPLPITIPVTGKGASGGPLADSDIRKALNAARDAYESNCGGHTTTDGEKEECAFVQK
ncbi:MAG: KOW domain-containing RNA-binding protein [Eubacteriales bacterium]|nr:KOW domain-containing RNA-binding protein [Eubacteriales bacterium]